MSEVDMEPRSLALTKDRRHENTQTTVIIVAD